MSAGPVAKAQESKDHLLGTPTDAITNAVDDERSGPKVRSPDLHDRLLDWDLATNIKSQSMQQK